MIDENEFAGFATEETYLRRADTRVQRRDRGVLTMRAGGEIYGLEIIHIREIIKLREITEVPRAPRFLLGIITVRGLVLPVIDLRLRLKLEAPPPGRSARILLVMRNNERFGLLVDGVSDVVRFADEQIEPPPSSFAAGSGTDSSMLLGIARYQAEKRERMVIMLSLDALLDFEIAPRRAGAA
jgi:purine-binding chemotaxis protein CheW